MAHIRTTKQNVGKHLFMRKKLLQHLLAAAMVILLTTGVHAQQTAKIMGSVQSADYKPVDAVTISLLKGADSLLVKISVSDKTGRFEFDNIKAGRYFIKAEAVGYSNYSGALITLTAGNTVQLEAVTLQSAGKDLSSVTVTATRPLVENKIDRTIVNVDASPTNTGLTALEVLEKSPGVTVDNDGNISLKGKQGVIVMIDGKPTYLTATQLASLLKSMSANQLDQVEIMTQPPAKYDAAGNSGVINIKTKKNKANGFNGSITSSAILAIYFKQTNSINVNWRQGKINIYGTYGYSHWEGFNNQDLSRSFRKDRSTPFSSTVQQHIDGHFTDFNSNYKTGIDYNASKNTTISAGLNGFVDNSFFKSSSLANFYDSLGHFTQYNKAQSNNKSPWKNIGVTLGLQQKLGSKGAELDATADYISYRSTSPQYSNNYLYNPDGTLIPKKDVYNPNPYLLKGYLPGTVDIYTGKVDFSTPLKNNITFEAGIKSSYVKTNNDAQYSLYDTLKNAWNTDTVRSNHFIYKENINAAYVSLQKQIKKLTVKLGVRAEQTIADGYQVKNNNSFKLNYTKLFPTAYISYQANDNNTFQVSYGRRIERPDYQDLNPFQFQLDRYTYEQGNPLLQPQFSHNFELGYNYKGALNLTLSYTTTNGIINDVIITQQDADKNYITYQTKQNVASNKNIGFSANYGKQLKKWWNINAFANVFNNAYKGYINGEFVDVSITSYSTNLSSRFTFNKGWSAEISGFLEGKNLVSSAIMAQPMGMFAIGAGKQLFKGKGSLRLNLRDPFYLMHFSGASDMNTFLLNVRSKWDNRRAILTFTYRFGKSTVQQQPKKGSAANDEQNRVKAGGGQQ
jgi:outer membrane receptor protein involved in Fe transport